MPVVALAAGGAQDIVRPDVHGVLVERAELGPLRDAVRAVAETAWDPAALRARALEFSTERFLERMRQWLDEASTQKRGRPVTWTA
jgi:glycosyltransferase involved in cell wall biosynthesis